MTPPDHPAEVVEPEFKLKSSDSKSSAPRPPSPPRFPGPVGGNRKASVARMQLCVAVD